MIKEAIWYSAHKESENPCLNTSDQIWDDSRGYKLKEALLIQQFADQIHMPVADVGSPNYKKQILEKLEKEQENNKK